VLDERLRGKLEEIAGAIGTPVYVVFEDLINLRADFVRNELSSYIPKLKIAYSYKANNYEEVCGAYHKLGFLSEVVSRYELGIAARLGVPNKNIIFNGIKNKEEVFSAINYGILSLNADSIDELGIVEEVLREYKREDKTPMGLRVKPKIGFPVPPHLGIEEDLLDSACSKMFSMNAAFVQLHAHIGTQITRIEPFKRLASKLCDLADKIERKYDVNLSINLGGGLPLETTPSYFSKDRNIPNLREYGAAIGEALSDDREVFLELGRSLVGPCGVLITKVIGIKNPANLGRLLIVDVSSFEVPSVLSLIHEVEPLHGGSEELVETDIYGNSCSSSDVIRVGAALPRDIGVSDLLIVRDVGAYCMNMSTSFVRPAPPAVFVRSSGEFHIMRREFSS